MKIVKHSISPQLRHVKNNFTIFVNFLIFNVICWCDFWKTGSKSCKLEVTFAIHLSDADVHEWSVFPFPHRADLSHHACCRASLSGESCWFSSCYSVSAIYLHYDSVRWKVIIEISIRKFKKNVKPIDKSAGCEYDIYQVNTSNRWSGDNGNDAFTESLWCWESGKKQVVKWTAEGAVKWGFPKYSATCWHTSVAGDMLVSC